MPKKPTSQTIKLNPICAKRTLSRPGNMPSENRGRKIYYSMQRT
jgi:hypothetical protein